MTGFDLGPALLFCPADRPDRFEKASERADAVILDLEDAVLPQDKSAARDAIARHPLDPDRTIVRVNPASTGELTADLEMLAATDYRWVMLPKAESIDDVAALGGGFRVIALCETAAGVLAAPELARLDTVDALMWGAEDLVASLGGTSSRRADGPYRDVARQARATVLLAAGAAGKAAIDTVHLDIADLDGLRNEVTDAVASGFRATACIHPGQVETIRDGFQPSQAQIDDATALLEAAERTSGVFVFHGRMVDEPALRHARATLRLAAKNASF